MSKKNNVYVIGHKNPDTDSICSAISYAYLKNELSQKQEEGAKYIMRGARIVSLPILEDEKLAGIITVSDIAYSDMDVYDNMILSKAGTSYKNIVETIDGEMIVGDLDGEFEEGHVLIAAANPDMMEGYIEPQDMVIVMSPSFVRLRWMHSVSLYVWVLLFLKLSARWQRNMDVVSS